MIKDTLKSLVNAINNQNKDQLNELISENCLLLNYDNKAYLTKSKIVPFLLTIETKITLINTVQDDSETLLTAFSLNNLFGSAIIRFTDHKVSYIKIILVK